MKSLLLIIAFHFSFSLFGQDEIYESEDLVIKRISEKTYLHISYLETEQWGKVACNGLFIMDGLEAVIMDSPVTEQAGKELINWIERDGTKIKAVIINHHHVDCLGSLEVFHDQGISSFSSAITKELAEEEGVTTPHVGFEESFEIPVGSLMTIHSFFGSGHALGNIASYVVEENVLFGGCMIKSLKSGKGNLADADTLAWSATVERIRKTYPEIEIVVPGHGAAGGSELLDFTIEMFRKF